MSSYIPGLPEGYTPESYLPAPPTGSGVGSPPPDRSLHRPILLANLYLDSDAVKNFAGKTINFHNVQFIARVLHWGLIDRSISNPPGSIQIDDAELEFADTDGSLRAWFDANTPFRRIAEIIFDYEDTVESSDSGVFLPVTGANANFTSNTGSPIPDSPWKPLFTGEITAVKFQPGKAIVRLREVTAKFLDWEIPKLITRDNFPNLPPDANEGASDYTAPIILGRVMSPVGTGLEPQGVIRCWHVDTTLNRYVVARHRCYSVPYVYRKKVQDAIFKQVNPAEYLITPDVGTTINGIVYYFTYIDFYSQQEDGAIISCDASGMDFRYNPSTGALEETSIEQRNPIDNLFNLIFYAANDHPFIQDQPQTYLRFNAQTFIDTIAATSGMFCDGALTDTMTLGQAVNKICDNFGVDFYEDNQAKMAVHLYNPASDSHIPIDISLVLLKTLEPELPTDMYTRVRYRYMRQNSGLTQYVKSAASDHWMVEKVLDNVTDQFELAQTGQNPLVEQIVELPFVRDEDLALSLMKTRMGYYNLRAYDCDFNVPMPEVISYLQLATCIAMTHVQGIGPQGEGWLNQPMRVYSLNFDLDAYVLHVKAIIRVPVPDENFQYSGATPVHDAQLRIPPLPVLINGTLASGVGPEIEPYAEPQIDINDTYPPAPDSSLDIPPSTFVLSFRDGTTQTVPSDDAAYVNVRWQEDRTLTPRKASAYVPIPNFRTAAGFRFYTGTLSPDTRPGGLGAPDIGKVVFYATDFDHEYLWVGTDETGTPSGWIAIEMTCGNVTLRWTSPGTRGWHVCDGSSVPMSDYKGDVSTVALPGPTLTGDTLLEVGNTPSDALASIDLTNNSSLPACLGAAPTTFNRFRLKPYMRL